MNEFKTIKEGNVYITTVNIKRPKDALLLDATLNSSRIQRRELKFGIDIDYRVKSKKNDSVDFIITISGDVEGVNNIENVDKIIHLLKSSI